MPSIIDSIINLVTPQMLSKAASSLGEDSSNLNTAAHSTIASMLGMLLQKKDASGLESLFNSAANSNAASDPNGLLNGNVDDNTKNIGSGFISKLFGDKVNAFTQLIGSHSGISTSSSSKLLSMLAPLVAGFLGNKMRSSGMNFSSLIGQLAAQKNDFMSLIPSGMGKLFNLPSSFSMNNNVSRDARDTRDVRDTKTYKKMDYKSMDWWKWLLPLLLVLGLLWWFMAAKNHKDGGFIDSQTTNTEQTTDSQQPANAMDNSSSMAATDTTTSANTDSTPMTTPSQDTSSMSTAPMQSNQEKMDIRLPDGSRINANKGGIEDQITQFLQSDDYKNASEEELSNKWFNFDNVNFEFNSGTQLTPGSQEQLQNIATILAFFKDAKIKIGAYTDKKGDDATNLQLSQQRADTIRNVLLSRGVPLSQIVGAEGYGSQFATVGESASDEERAQDRRMAIRFVK